MYTSTESDLSTRSSNSHSNLSIPSAGALTQADWKRIPISPLHPNSSAELQRFSTPPPQSRPLTPIPQQPIHSYDWPSLSRWLCIISFFLLPWSMIAYHTFQRFPIILALLICVIPGVTSLSSVILCKQFQHKIDPPIHEWVIISAAAIGLFLAFLLSN
ncbi:MAG: hypothetical protein AAGJ35_00515 [Myxococcota bacterium]